jgi:hypothetical protein
VAAAVSNSESKTFSVTYYSFAWGYTIDTEHGHESKEWVIHQDGVFAKIKSSAALSLGRIEHSNLSGCLQNQTLSFGMHMQTIIPTYTKSLRRTNAVASTGISLPFLSVAFVTLNTDRTDEVTVKIAASTK